MVLLPWCRAGGGCVVVLECGHCIVVVVVEPIIGCHVIESDDVALGSVVNNKVRGGNGDLLRIETMNDDYVVVHHLPHRCQQHGTLDSIVYSWPVVIHWVTWHCGGYGRWMWVVANGDSDDDMMVAMRRRW